MKNIQILPVVTPNVFIGKLENDYFEFRTSVTENELEYLVKNIGENDSLYFYNKVFEDRSFVFIHNGSWFFYDFDKSCIDNWCWSSDMQDIIENDFKDEPLDIIEEFTKGWTASNYHFSDLVVELFKNTEINNVYLDKILNPVFSKEEQALTIIKTHGISDLQKVKLILNLKD